MSGKDNNLRPIGLAVVGCGKIGRIRATVAVGVVVRIIIIIILILMSVETVE